MASVHWKRATIMALCVMVEIAYAQYGESYAPHYPGGVYPPQGQATSHGVVPPQMARPPAYIAPPTGQVQSQSTSGAQSYSSATTTGGYPLNYQMARQDDAAPMPAPEAIPAPMSAPMSPPGAPAGPPTPQPSVVEIQQGTPVYGGAPMMNYRDVAQDYVHEALTNCQPSGTPWSGAQYGHAHRGCGPTYPVWGCDAGNCRPRIGQRLKGRLIGDSGACEPSAIVACDSGPKWFASSYGLLLKRSKGSFHPLSEDAAASAIALSSTSVAFPYQGGVEVRIGKYLNPELALEGGWWTLFEEPVETTIYGSDYAGGLSTRVDYSALDIVQGGGPAANVQSYYDGAWMHRLRRSFSLSNVELNVLQIPICGAPCMTCGDCGCGASGASCGPAPSRINLSWHVGARYLRLDEELEFATDFANGAWGDGVDEVFHCVDMENHLVGTQAGGHMFVPLTGRLSLFTNASVGVFNNHMRQDQRVFNADGWAYVNGGPYAGQDLRIRSQSNHTAIMGELRTGVHCQISHRWRGTFIYRTIGLANVALPEHQIPGSFADLADVRKIRGSGSVVLHGFMFGMETRF